MTYPEVIQYLYEKLPMYQRVGSIAFKKDLTNTIALCEVLGNPHQKFKTVHIAGTNGKGSVSHFLSSIFQEAGYKTGLYTSPHLIDFRERIKINGEWISESFVVQFVEKIKPHIEKIEPSFFEITVAMAFDYFASEKVDIAIIETGLGGRLDSTNIITPELSVITNIGYDHKDMLGDTLILIAGEKAGIIKPNIPIVIGEKQDEIISVFDAVATERNAPLFYAQENWKLISSIHEELLELTFENKMEKEVRVKTPLAAFYQISNIRTVLTAISLLKRNFSISEEALRKGVEKVVPNTGFSGRWQVVERNPKIVLDCAHNLEGVVAMLEQLKFESFSKLYIIYGCVKDKDYQSILSVLPKEAQYYFTKPDIMRAASPEDIGMEAKKIGLKYQTFSHANDALNAAKSIATSEDLIIGMGSVFLVSDILKLYGNS